MAGPTQDSPRGAGPTDTETRAERPSPPWLGPILKPLRPAVRELLVMSLFVNLLALATPVFVLQVYDRVVHYAGLNTLRGLVIGMAIAIIFDFVLRQARSRMLQRVALRIDVEIGRKLFDKVTALPLRILEGRPSAYWQALFRDVDVIRNTFSGASAVLVSDLPFAVLFVGFIFVIAPPIAWLLLVVLPIFVFLAWRSASVLGKASADEHRAAYGRDAMIAEMVAARGTVKALALDEALKPVWEDRYATTIEHSIARGGKADNFVNMGLGLTVFTTVLLTSVGALAIIEQRLSIGALIATNMLVMRVINPFQQLVTMWRTYAQARQSVRRLGEAFAQPEDRRESEVALERPKGELGARDLIFRYGEDAAPAIDGVRLRLAPGALNAIVGRNGSGKTTLLKLLQGLYRPEAGRVLLDGADIAQFSRRELARWIGYLPQDSVLFAGTVRDNISQADPGASDEEVLRAARLAGVHSLVIDMPDGYGTEIGEAGTRLSSGMRQRIAVARALLGDPPVLLLDEPSSDLDRQAEEDLRTALVELARDRTVLVVTHSPILLAACHNVIVMDRGKIGAAGPSREILPRLFSGGGKPVLERRA